MDFNKNITINDFNAICRLCLKCDSNLKPIFKRERIEDTPTVDEMINFCIGLEVHYTF